MNLAICIPTYKNHLPLLERCLDSIQAQTRQPNIVAISISSVQASEIQLRPRPFPIRIITTEQKRNAAENRNEASSLVKEATHLSFIDSDDEMEPNRLAYIERAFLEHSADFVLHSFLELKDKPIEQINPIYRSILNPFFVDMRPYAGLYVSHLPPIHNAHVSVRNEIFGIEKYRTNLIVEGYSYGWEDTEYNRRLQNLGYKGVYLPIPLSIYH